MLLFDLITYWSVGLRPGVTHFFVYLIATLLFNLACGALSIAVTMGAKTGGVASLGIILLLLFSMMFGGFLSSRETIPSWIGWAQVSFFHTETFYFSMPGLVCNNVGLTPLPLCAVPVHLLPRDGCPRGE